MSIWGSQQSGSIWGGQSPMPNQGGSDIERAKIAIARIESGGLADPYTALGKPNSKGQKAYGKYQVMDFNVPSWTKEALGVSMTPEQFHKNPQAQEKVFEYKFNQYAAQYGGYENAARVWIGGPGGLTNPTAKDVNGTSVEGYANNFSNSFGKMAGSTSPVFREGDPQLLKDTAQSIGSGWLAAGQAISNRISNAMKDPRTLLSMPDLATPFRQEQGTAFGRLTQAISGTDQPISLAGEDKKLLGDKYGGKTGGTVSLALTALDLFGGGEVRSTLKAAQIASKLKTVEEVVPFMRYLGYSEETILKFAPTIAKETGLKRLEETFAALDKLKNAKSVPVPQRGETASAPKGSPLTVYRSGDAFDVSKITEKGVSVGKTEDAARFFNSGESKGMQKFSISSDAKILQFDSIPQRLINDVQDAWRAGGNALKEEQAIVNYARSRGYDAVDLADLGEGEIRILNAEVLKQASVPGGASLAEGIPVSGYKRGGTPVSSYTRQAPNVTPYKAVKAPNPQSGMIKWPFSKAKTLSEKLPPSTPSPVSESSVGRVNGNPQNKGGVLPAKNVSAGIPPATGGSVPPTKGISSTKGSVPSPESSPARIGKSMKDVWTKVVEYVQNTDLRVKQVQERKGIIVSDVSNPYQKMTLFHGRVGAKIEAGYAQAKEIANDLVALVGRGRASVAAGREELNTYLQALHAPERNAALGDGAAGMTTAEALKVTGSARAEIKAIAQKALALNKQTLEMLHDTGVITDDLFNTLTTKYKNHVPLQRVMEETDDIGSVLSGRGFDVKSTGIKAAVGSDKKVADIITNILNNYEQAVLRSEKNIYDNATLAFFRNNEKDLVDIGIVRKPKVVGKTFDGQMVLERTTDPKILQMFEKGKPVWIEFNDERVAIAYRGVGREKQGVLMSMVSTFSRFYSSLATRFSPDFAAANKIRDLQEMMVYMASQKDVKLKGSLGALVGDPASVKDVIDGLRGADTPGARLYNKMRFAGGNTGSLGLSTRKQTQMDVDAIFATASSRPREAVQKLVEYVDNWNTVFEDSTRLSVYKAALARGLTEDRAAFLAKEATINFNRSGKGGPVINGLYMFANASIQGSAKMMMAMKNPKVAATVAATVGTSVAAISEWNTRVDPDWRNKVTKWDRTNGLPILLPTDDGSTKYLVIPVSWGIKPILVMTNEIYDALDGQEVNTAQAMGHVLSSIMDGYNPVGGTDLASALTPTIADVPNEIRANQSWSGSKIRPDYDKNAPKDIQYFASLKDTTQGRLSIKTSEAARSAGILVSPADINYVTDQYIGGAGRFVKRTFDLGYGTATDQVPPADNWPFVARFLRERTAEETGQGTAGETSKIQAVLSDESRARFQLKQEALDTYKTLQELPPDVAAARFDLLAETNPELAKKIVDTAKDEKLGLTYTDSLIKSLGVADGERAKYIKSKFDALKSDKEKAALWDDMVTKKIITPDVAAQMSSLYQSGK